jgi:hypothetical protein
VVAVAAVGCSTPKPPALARDLTCPGVDVLTQDQLETSSLVARQSSLFWVSFHSTPPASFSGNLPADIMTMPSVGGAPQAVASVNTDSRLGATDTDLFFTVGDAGEVGSSAVFRQAMSGGGATALGDFLGPRPVVDRTQAYFYEYNVGGGRVLQVADGGAGLQPIVTASQSEQIEAMVIVDGGFAYLTRTLNPEAYSVHYVATPGATPVAIASGLGKSFQLGAGAAGLLYGWVQDGANNLGSIQTLPVSGGTITPLFPSTFKEMGAIVVIGAAVYFVGQQSTDSDLGLFVVEPSGAPKRIDCGYFGGYSLVTDGTYLYWGQDSTTKAAVFRMLAPGP